MERIDILIKGLKNYKDLVNFGYDDITLLVGEEIDGGWFLQYAVAVPEWEDLNSNADLGVIENNPSKEYTFKIGEELSSLLNIDLDFF